MRITSFRSIVLLGMMSVIFMGIPDVFAAWTPPIGIPRPTFGIEESHFMYSGQLFDYNGVSAPYGNAGNGPYSHYIDNTYAQATDTNNPFGTPAKPRLTIPVNLAPGSVVELHGGPYNYEIPGQSGDIYVNGGGTVSLPIFIRGFSQQNKTEFIRVLRIRGSYIVLENVIFHGPQPAGLAIMAPSNHIGVRHTEATGLTDINQGNTYNIAPAGNDDIDFNEIVFYSNHLHDNGYPAADDLYLHNDFQVSGNSRRTTSGGHFEYKAKYRGVRDPEHCS